ncbi:MAG: alpha/beta fold hydrolase, partial [Bacteroidia bacterium]
RSQILMKTGVLLKSIVPYLWLYKVFAFVIMPNKNHKESRLLFVREAKKLYQKEFIRWLKLSSEINPLLRFFRTVDINIPTLYIMGEEDYLFLPTIKKIAADHASALLVVIEKCGHVVNVERPQIFNDTVLGWLNAKHN